MLNFLTVGTLLGLSAGFAPGPLLTLVISETLQHDVKSGIKVALAPIITDLPIIVLTLIVLAKLSNFHTILGIISLTGGFFVLFIGWQGLRTKDLAINLNETKPTSLAKGILANALNPHPYLFWFSVGAPTTIKALHQNSLAPAAFIGSFYVCLVGSKLLLAVLAGKSKNFLRGNVYIYTMRCLGLVLCVLAVVLFRDGFKLLGLV
jgi:threonine/homoserine/homoserine lactone efflux protein